MLKRTPIGEQLVIQAYNAWNALGDFRRRRRRSRGYYRNRPDEQVLDPETNQWIPEEEYIAGQGRVPIRLNRVKPVVKNMKGQFRQNKTTRIAFPRNREDALAGEMMSEGLRYVADVNMSTETDADNIVEAMISGLWGYKAFYGFHRRLVRDEVIIDELDTERIFFNQNVKNRRLGGLDLIGEIHHISVDEIVAMFAKNRAQERELRERFAWANDRWSAFSSGGFYFHDANDFNTSGDPSLATIIEVWRYEYNWDTFIHDPATGVYERSDLTEQEVMVLNAQRILEHQAIVEQAAAMGVELPPEEQDPQLVGIDPRFAGKWRYYFMTPWGEILAEGDTPYLHEQHPYHLGFLDMLDGEIWGAVEDIIDPQRLINRLTQSLDFMFAAGAKGVLVIPEDSIPDDLTIDDIASEWTKFNGVIRLKLKPGVPIPEQIHAAALPVGVFNWMEMLGADIKEISGVSGPQQGMDPNAGTPARLYQQQIEQAQVTTRDLFDNFFAVRRQRDLMVCQLIAQYYNEPKYLSTAGRRADGTKYIKFNPAKVRDIEFDVIINDAPDTPAYREMAEKQLAEFLATNRLTFRQYLQMSGIPQAEAIMAMINQTNPLLAEKQIDPQMAAQLQMMAQSGDPDAMATVMQAQ